MSSSTIPPIIEELPKPDELSRLPTRVISLSTLWPQIVSGTLFVISLISWLKTASPQAASIALLTGAVFILTAIYLYSMLRQHHGLLVALPWIGGFTLSILFVVVSSDLLSVSVICIVAAASYALASSTRRQFRRGLIGCIVVMALTFGLAEMIRAGVIQTGLSLSPLATRWISGIFLLAILSDLMQRLWRHFNRTEAAFTRLQITNDKLIQTKSDLNRKVEQHTKLLEVSRVIGSTLGLSELLDVILEQLRQVVDYGGASIMILKDNAVSVLSTTGHLTRYAQLMESPLETTPYRMQVVLTGKPLVVYEMQPHEFFNRSQESAINNGSTQSDLDTTLENIGTWMGVPLVVRGKVIGLLAMTHPLSGFFSNDHAELTMAFANQVAVAIEGARAREEAIRSAALAERNRLARELHDSVSQNLFGITLGLRTALANPKQTLQAGQFALELAETGLAEMRALIFELRPESLREDGLLTAFRKQATAMVARNKIELNLSLGDQEPDISLVAKEALYRIGMEALQNASRHAMAQSIELKLACQPNQVVLEIIDNGRGFDTSGAFPGHLGLRSMRERAEQYHGSLQIESTPGKGTRVCATMPI